MFFHQHQKYGSSGPSTHAQASWYLDMPGLRCHIPHRCRRKTWHHTNHQTQPLTHLYRTQWTTVAHGLSLTTFPTPPHLTSTSAPRRPLLPPFNPPAPFTRHRRPLPLPSPTWPPHPPTLSLPLDVPELIVPNMAPSTKRRPHRRRRPLATNALGLLPQVAPPPPARLL